MRYFDKKRSVTFLFFFLVFAFLVFFTYQGCVKLSFKEAENSLSSFLLNQRAIHSFVAEVQRPELYRLQHEKILSPDYFSPILFSRTYIARNIRDLLNRERENEGLERVVFRLAAKNPRNPINAADSFELGLLDQFNEGAISSYKKILDTDSGKVLYYALPVAANSEECLRCHGDPVDAPPVMLKQYGAQSGFFEKKGDIRAMISANVPLDGLLQRAHLTTLTLSGITFCLLLVFLMVVLSFFRRIDRQQEESKETSYYLDSILQSSSDTAIIVTGAMDTIVYFNKAAETLLGTSAENVRGRGLSEVHRVFGNGSVDRIEKKIENIKKVGAYRFSIFRNDRNLDVRISSISDNSGSFRGLLFIGHDITDQVAVRKEQEEMQARLHKAEKMESIGLMASGVAHDLNNILAGITSYPELILMNLEDQSPLRRPLKAVEEAGLRAAAVVDDLLTVARGAAIVKEVVSLNELIDEFMASPEHRKLAAGSPDVSWQVGFERKLKNVLCAPVHFKKCMMNLLRNGVEAVKGNGIITISTESVEVSEDRCAALGLRPGEYSVVSLRDTGPGISTPDIEHIFEPFYTKKKMGVSGTGLGLSVVWNTMQDHGGAVTVQSEVGRGTTFKLFFPVSEESSVAMVEEESVESLQGDNELILVVDDEERLRDIASQKLIALGYRVEVAASGEEAISFLEDHPVDLVLLDMIMDPGINGYETYKRIIKIRPGQKALVVSGYSTSDEIGKATRLGVGGLLKKPYTLVQLGQAIRQVIGKK